MPACGSRFAFRPGSCSWWRCWGSSAAARAADPGAVCHSPPQRAHQRPQVGVTAAAIADTAFRYFFQQVDVGALCGTIRDWTIVQILCGEADVDQLRSDGKTLRSSIEPTTGGG